MHIDVADAMSDVADKCHHMQVNEADYNMYNSILEFISK